jgi:hypothetical protein
MSKVNLGDFNYFLSKVLRCETIASQITVFKFGRSF